MGQGWGRGGGRGQGRLQEQMGVGMGRTGGEREIEYFFWGGGTDVTSLYQTLRFLGLDHIIDYITSTS